MVSVHTKLGYIYETVEFKMKLFPPASGTSWGILNRYWLDPDKNAKSPKCFANFHKLPEVTRQKEGYF